MGTQDRMEFCITGPNATCVRDWCRENAKQWMSNAFDVLEKSCDNFTIQMDALTPDFLKTVLSQTITDEKIVDMHVENCATLKLNGKFTADKLIIKPCIIIAGLYSKNPQAENIDPFVEHKWERWGFLEDDNFGDWKPKYVVFCPLESQNYRMSTVYNPIMYMDEAIGGSRSNSNIISKDEAIIVAGNLMSNSMQNVSFMNAKLFYSFKISTEPWTFNKRKGLAAILNTVTKKTSEDSFTGKGWLTKTHPSFQESEWVYPPLGPQQPVWVGAVHVTCDSFKWHSAIYCSIRISEDPRQFYHPIIINVITTW